MPRFFQTARAQAPPRAGVDLTAAYATFNVTFPLLFNDLFYMFRVPKGATVLEAMLSCSKLENGATMQLALGDTTSPSRFIFTNSVPQTGGVVRADRLNGPLYTYPADSMIMVAVTVGAASPVASGSITAVVRYQIQQ